MARNDRHVAVALAGGAGTRLWPLSRADRPKPFLPLIGSDDLFSLTLARLARIAPVAGIDELLIVGSVQHLGHIEARMAMAGHLPWRILLEPTARNTAPAIAAASHYVCRRHSDAAILSIFPGDHFVADWEAFGHNIAQAVMAARTGALVCVGIPPDAPNTGYGYIEVESPDEAVQPVLRFTEKPDAEIAASWVGGGHHFWNAGILAFAADTMVAEFHRQAPDILACALGAVEDGRLSEPVFLLDAESFGAARSISVDHAILENASRRQVVRADFGWSDLGSWDQLAHAADATGLSSEHILFDSDRVLVTATDRLVVALGVKNIVVADTPDVLLIADLAHSQQVVEALKTATLLGPDYGERTDTPSGLRNLARRNRSFAQAMLAALPENDRLQLVEASVDHEATVELSASRMLELLSIAIADAPGLQGSADQIEADFVSRFYLAQDWRLSAPGIPEGYGETRAHYAWAAAWARNCQDRKDSMAEVARRLAVRAETSGLGADGRNIRAGFSAVAPADDSKITAAMRVEALALLRKLGFVEFARALE